MTWNVQINIRNGWKPKKNEIFYPYLLDITYSTMQQQQPVVFDRNAFKASLLHVIPHWNLYLVPGSLIRITCEGRSWVQTFLGLHPDSQWPVFISDPNSQDDLFAQQNPTFHTFEPVA